MEEKDKFNPSLIFRFSESRQNQIFNAIAFFNLMKLNIYDILQFFFHPIYERVRASETLGVRDAVFNKQIKMIKIEDYFTNYYCAMAKNSIN